MTPPVSPLAALLLIGAMDIATASAADDQLQLSVGAEYSSLRTDNGPSSTIWYAPFSVRQDIGQWTLRATIPYLSITAPQNLIVVLDDDPGGASGGNGRQIGSATSTSMRTVSGIGDSTLSAVYSFDEIGNSALYVDAGARVRLPTGDARRGTGTGATDFGLSVETGLDLEHWGAALNAGRRYLGRVEELDRVNGWQAGCDAWLYLGRHSRIGVFYEWRNASERDLDDPREAGIYASYQLSHRWKLRVDVSRALELDGSNYTVALTLYWRPGEPRLRSQR